MATAERMVGSRGFCGQSARRAYLADVRIRSGRSELGRWRHGPADDMHHRHRAKRLGDQGQIGGGRVDGVEVPGHGCDNAFLGLGAYANDNALAHPRCVNELEVVRRALGAADPNSYPHDRNTLWRKLSLKADTHCELSRSRERRPRSIVIVWPDLSASLGDLEERRRP